MAAKMNYATIDNLMDASFEEAIQDCLSKLANRVDFLEDPYYNNNMKSQSIESKRSCLI